MSRRSRISLTVDTPNLILSARLYSLYDEADGAPDLVDHLKAAGQPWLYNIIIDFRRFEAILDDVYIAYLANKWAQLERGRDGGKRLCVVTSDPCLKARLSGLSAAMPQREVALFDCFDQGLDWTRTGDAKLREAATATYLV